MIDNKQKMVLRGIEMKNAPDEKMFIFWNGEKARNIFDLTEVIEKISEQEFYSYVNDWKNDFAKWISDVFNDSSLAVKLGKEKSRQGNLRVLKEVMNIESSERMFFGFFKKKDKYPVKNSSLNKKNVSIEEETKHEDELKKEILVKERSHTKKQKQQKNNLSVTFIQAKKKLFNFGSKKQLEEKVYRLDEEFKKEDEEVESSTEQMVWILLYGLLVGLVIILLIYKFVFNGSLG